MRIVLDKAGLVSLVCGTDPSMKLMKAKVIEPLGDFSGSYLTWSWNKSILQKLPEASLYSVYLLCVESWEEEEES